MSLVLWILEHKLLTCLLIVSGSLFISTTVLGVQKSELTDELNDCQSAMTTTTSTTKPTIPTTTEGPTTTTEAVDIYKYRLPKDVKPLSYELTIKPNLETGLFTGTAKIEIDVETATTEVVLNSHKLVINSVAVEGGTDVKHVLDAPYERLTITKKDGFAKGQFTVTIEYQGDMKDKLVGLYTTKYSNAANELVETVTSSNRNDTMSNTIMTASDGDDKVVQGFDMLEQSQMVKINLNRDLDIGRYDITVSYRGSLLNKTVGFYKSVHKRYINGTIKKRPIATTKFEPTYARQAYPCFDEPNLKATYTVHLLKSKDEKTIAISNMPQEGVPTVSDEGITVHFQKSVKMSTYLACFIIGNFEFEEIKFGPTAEEKPLRVYVTEGQKAKADYALKTGKKVMDFYLDYFKIPYPLPKLDMAAIPDFASGAMENWGLVTYRETALLFDEATGSAANKARVAEVIAHELAHSWFGNLVTMDWWDDLWLNEGFASYIEYKGVIAAEPDWQHMDQFLIADLHDVLVLDATTASHPIVEVAETPDQITSMFDTISYKKGASILRMLEDAITEDSFQTGVTEYLNAHKLGNAVSNDFWIQMDKVAPGLDIPAIMSTWTTQMGYPVLTVTKDGQKYTLKQARYLTNSGSSSSNFVEYKWTIPVTYFTSANKEKQLKWFSANDAELVIEAPGEWIKFNYHQTGYYRVNYPEAEWTKLAGIIKTLDITDRAHLLEESFRLAESGHLSYKIPLELAKFLKEGDKEFVTWTVANKVLTQLKKYLFNFASYADYNKYVGDLVRPAALELTWDEKDTETFLDKRTRTVVLTLSCAVGDLDCLGEAKTKFDEWIASDEDNLPANLRTIIYNYGIISATPAQWAKVLTKFQTTTDANEKIRLLDALASVRNPELLQRLILFAENRDNIRDQDYFTCMGYISNNPSGTSLVWNYVRDNWQKLVVRFGLNERYLGRMIPTITKSFATQTALEEMKGFFAKYPNAGAGVSARAEALETVINNINWVEKYEKIVSDWIAEYVKP